MVFQIGSGEADDKTYQTAEEAENTPQYKVIIAFVLHNEHTGYAEHCSDYRSPYQSISEQRDEEIAYWVTVHLTEYG